MKKSFSLLLLLGLAYLYILEDVGNFITLNLVDFQKSLGELDPTRIQSSSSPVTLLRTPTDLLLEQQYQSLTPDEWAYIQQQVVQIDQLVNQSSSEGVLKKLDLNMMLYDNFYKKLIFDVVQSRQK